MRQKVRATLKYLRRVNPQHQNVLIKDCNINEDLLSSGSNLPKNNIPFIADRYATNKSLTIYN